MSLFNRHKSEAPGGKPTTLPSDLQDETAKFKAIVNSIEDGVLLLDSQHTIQLINPGGATILGWKAEDATGIDIGNVMRLVNSKSEPVKEQDNPILQVFQTGQSGRSEVVLITPDKKQVPLNLRLSPLLGKNQEVKAVVVVFNNITAQQAEERQRADFISTASHEMRTPVAAIEGYLALALNEKVSTVDSRARNYLEKAHSSTQHLGKLFQDLLTSAKAEDGRLTSHPAVVEMGAFLEQLVDGFHLIAEKKGLFVEFSFGGSNTINATEAGTKVIKPLYYVYIDPDRLREVITNLFDNAVKYTPEGKITIGLTGNDSVVQMYVRDTGPGIPTEDIPHLFQKFYRVDNSATRTIGGTGLGLFICRKIIELYNGRIWAESKVGEGSSFYINLPRLSTQKASAMQAAASNSVSNPVNSVS
ncbi:MAG TPA: ATP-binding protein [Candidatus Saccharimonadia bacterium]|nr:ATP-binding protein [Candidatus Saccharimonadia bacterium]